MATTISAPRTTHLPTDWSLADILEAGVRLVWYIDPPSRSAMVYTSADDPGTRHAENEPLSGGDVLPNFTLSLAQIFQEADREANPS